MNPVSVYELVDRAYPFRLRGNDNQQNDTGLIWSSPGAGRDASTGDPRGRGVGVGGFSLHNRSGGAIAMGIGVRIPNHFWVAGTWDDDATTPFTDDTTDAQDDGGDDVALETLTANDGIVIASQVLFNAVSIDVSTASAGGAPVRALRYTNPTGAGWIDFANLFLQDASTGQYATGENLLVWSPPADWGRTQAGGLSGIPAGRYAVNLRATTAPATTAGRMDSCSIYRLYWLTEGIADNGTLEVLPGSMDLWMPSGNALVAFFQTANNQNRVSALVRARE